MITGAQVRAARKLLNWSQADFAARIGIAQWILVVFENGLGIPADLPGAKIVQALEREGVEFIAEGQVRRKR